MLQETLLYSQNSRSKAYLVTLAKIQDMPAHEGLLELYSSIWSDWPTSKQKVYVMEIVLPLGFADVIFWERSDDRKYICGSQANLS